MSDILMSSPGGGRGWAFWLKLVVTVLSALAASVGASAMIAHGGMPPEGAQLLAFGLTAGAGTLIMTV